MCWYPHIDSNSSLWQYYKILLFGVHQVLPFQNFKWSTKDYMYVYSVQIFFSKSSRKTVPEKKYYYVKTSAHDRTWYYITVHRTPDLTTGARCPVGTGTLAPVEGYVVPVPTLVDTVP